MVTSFDKFSDRARNTLSLSEQEARGLGHVTLNTAHVVLGLLSEQENAAARLLQSHGLLDLEVLRADLRTFFQAEEGPRGTGSPMPHSTRLDAALESAQQLALGHSGGGTVTCAYLLLGLLSDHQSAAVMLLTQCGVAVEELEKELVARIMAGPRNPALVEPSSPITNEHANERLSDIASILRMALMGVEAARDRLREEMDYSNLSRARDLHSFPMNNPRDLDLALDKARQARLACDQVAAQVFQTFLRQ